ncbi:MAG: hypothetical protein HY788_06485 [Deltaproteobacteria bacterium]|nr:hypothetical protein [Deltaproteobacteria bacterium]
MGASSSQGSMYNVLIQHEDNIYTAHCLELDIVTEAPTLDQVKLDIVDLIRSAIEYAFRHDNLDHLFRAAPLEIWEEFYRCLREDPSSEREEIKIEIPSAQQTEENTVPHFIPPWVITNVCRTTRSTHVA